MGEGDALTQAAVPNKGSFISASTISHRGFAATSLACERQDITYPTHRRLAPFREADNTTLNRLVTEDQKLSCLPSTV